ncbi:hypothetical protein AD006_01200 [Pseudonocardia sp. EC080610-09]|nr:hypothetical protein FRP1_22010 [Pseudonocardia sp. EC080625-04]ALL74283.1 hypothetical protein AD006_01200 [Pseudonocardia sp. EC080610-09]ALL81306.1 hypothetical protein AD017_09025 [Pseudonocardia sp. EC080619-01]
METGLELSNSNNVESATLTGYFQPTANGTLRASLFWQRTQGGSAVTSYGLGDWPLNLYIEDLGKI